MGECSICTIYILFHELHLSNTIADTFARPTDPDILKSSIKIHRSVVSLT